MNGFGRSTLILSFSLLTAACGRKGALIYPDMLIPAAPAVVSGHQSGTAVKLQFTLPDKDRSGRSIQGVSGVKISRMASEADRSDVCPACLTEYLPVRTLYLEHLPLDTQRFGNRLIMLDGEVTAGSSYSYRIVPFTADGVDGAAASLADVRVVPPFPAPEIHIEAFPTELRLKFAMQPPLTGRLLGYNVYRSTVAGGKLFQPLNREPLTEALYVDSGLERGVTYRYSARALLVPATTGHIMESLGSEEVEGMLKDDE